MNGSVELTRLKDVQSYAHQRMHSAQQNLKRAEADLVAAKPRYFGRAVSMRDAAKEDYAACKSEYDRATNAIRVYKDSVTPLPSSTT